MSWTKKLLPVAALLVALPLSAGTDHAYDFLVAKMAAEEGETAKALAGLERLIAEEPGNLTLQYEHALVLTSTSDLKRSENELRKITAAAPDFYDAQRLLGRILLDQVRSNPKAVNDALEHLAAAFKLKPDDLASGMSVAQIYLGLNRLNDAETVLATLTEEAPTNKVINFQYAELLTKLGRGNESKTYLERAVEVDPTYRAAILPLIDIYTEGGEFDKAAELLQPLIEEDPTNLDLQRQQSLYLLRAGQPARARALLEPLIKAAPDDVRTRYFLAEAMTDLGKHADAEVIYRQLLEKSPQDSDFLTSFALNQIAQKKYDQAAQTFKTILDLPALPENLKVMAKTQLAAIALEKSDEAGALQQALDVVSTGDRLNLQAINLALEIYTRQKKYDEALAFLDSLLKDHKEEPLLVSRRLEMLVRAGRDKAARDYAASFAKAGGRAPIFLAEAWARVDHFDEAVALLEPLSASQPDDLDLKFELGGFQERAGKRHEAEATFLSILAAKPDHAQTLNYLGYMWADRGENLDRAADMLSRAVKQEPDNGAYVDSLGWVYFRQGKLDLAEKYLTDATRLMPDDPTVRQHLGDVVSRQGDSKKALEIYKFALTLKPEPKEQQELRFKISELEKKSDR